MKTRTILTIVAFAAVLLIGTVVHMYPAHHRIKTPSVRGLREATSTVERVIDGDTVQLSSGERVRYIGINTPETVKPNFPVECFGSQAHEQNAALVEGKQVRLVKDISDVDKYGRLLRFVYVGDELVNLQLVQQGFARVETVPPNFRYEKEFVAAAVQARADRRGLWGFCKGSTMDN